MKKTITLLTTVLMFIAVEVDASRLFLSTNTFKSTANISGNVFFSYDGYFEISNLRPGNHRIAVSQRNGRVNYQSRNHRYGRGYGYGRGSGYDRRYGNRSHMPIFRGSIFIPQQSDVYARITPRGHLIIDQVVPKRPRRQQHQPRRGGGRDYGNRNWDNRNLRTCGTPPGVVGPDRSNFGSVLELIRDASFDSEKRTIAKQYLNNNDVTSQEVLQLIQLMDFESTRLDIAKYAYNSTIDPENYFIVNKGFDFSSSTNALNRHIQRR